MRIDAHQHFWRYNPEEYSWIDGTMGPLQRDFLPQDLYPVLEACGVSSTLAVEARQTLEETYWLLSLAERAPAAGPSIAGVVGYAPLADSAFATLLPGLLAHDRLRGLRHGVQSEADPHFLRGADFNAGIALLAGSGLVYDLLIRPDQLEESERFVARHPAQCFVLDHCGKPPLAGGDLAGWQRQIARLAQHANVHCKLSGLATEAAWQSWTPAGLAPAWETVLDCFGPARLLWGSDWPVATLATDYRRWIETVERWLAPLRTDERDAVWGRNAARVYNLSPAAAR